MLGLGFGGLPGIGSSDITVKYVEAKIPPECIKEAIGGVFCGLSLSTLAKGDSVLLDSIMNALNSIAKEHENNAEKSPPKKEK